jgi:hypothetical protein
VILDGRVRIVGCVDVSLHGHVVRRHGWVPGDPIQRRNAFPSDFDVVLISLNTMEVVSRWSPDTAKAPSLQVVAEVLLQHVMVKIWGSSAEVASMWKLGVM